jgi:hypothetical protein
VKLSLRHRRRLTAICGHAKETEVTAKENRVVPVPRASSTPARNGRQDLERSTIDVGSPKRVASLIEEP